MTYEQLKDLKPGDFKRAGGVSPQTFEDRRHILRAHEQSKVNPGRPPKLSLENRLLMTLPYWREYRPSFHSGLAWGVDESVVCRPGHKIEHQLLTSKVFQVPGKKRLCAQDTPCDVIGVAAAESPVERPQNNSGDTTVGRSNAIRKKRSSASLNGRAKSSVSPLARDESTISTCSSAAGWPLRKRSSV